MFMMYSKLVYIISMMIVISMTFIDAYMCFFLFGFFFQAEDGIRDLVRSRGLGDVYKRQTYEFLLSCQTTGPVSNGYHRLAPTGYEA